MRNKNQTESISSYIIPILSNFLWLPQIKKHPMITLASSRLLQGADHLSHACFLRGRNHRAGGNGHHTTHLTNSPWKITGDLGLLLFFLG